MLKTGLVSISFRNLSTDEIIYMVSMAGLDAIEWGGDIHVPHGNIIKAREVKKSCEISQIECQSYGSYYRVGEYEDYKSEFKKVLDCAIELDSEIIRVWAGNKPTFEADKDYWNKIVDELRKICDMADYEGMNIGLEYHSNTLTDNSTDTLKLLALTNADNLSTYWQPPVGLSLEENLHDIRILKNYISNIHTFTWNNRERLLLSAGYDSWNEYLKLLNKWKPRYCMLEFVLDDKTENFYRDAVTLKKLTEKFG